MTAAEFAERAGGRVPNGKGMIKCPAHLDGTASLSVGTGTNGKLVIHCLAGCKAEDVLAAVGLRWADVLGEKERGDRTERRTYYDYRDERGELLYQVVRIERAGKKKEFLQRRPHRGSWAWGLRAGWYRLRPSGDWNRLKDGETPRDGDGELPEAERTLFRLPELLAIDAADEDFVFIPEGEKDALRLVDAKLIAVCNSEGAGKWRPELAEFLRGRNVVVLPDNDRAGRSHASDIARSLDGKARIRVVPLDGIPEKGDVSDWLAAGHTADELVTIARKTSEWSPAPEPEPDTFAHALKVALADVKAALEASADVEREPLFTNVRDLFEREYEPTPWAVSGLVARGGIAVIGGEPKESAKTWVATEIAVAVATGTPVFSEFYAARGIAAYFFAEDQARQIRNRTRACLAARVLDVSAIDGRLHVCPRGQFLDVLRDEDLAWIVASCRMLGPIDLLVLDPLRDIHSGEENESDSMRDVMRRLRLLGDLLACTVMAPHHVAKASPDTKKRKPGQRLRGSGAIHGSIDSGIYIDPRGGGDGRNRFELGVTSQVKGARSAGWFSLDLTVTDDAGGEAVSATWKVDQGKAKTKASEQSDKDDTRMFDFVRQLVIRGEHCSRTALRNHDERPIPEKRAVSAVERLIEAGRLVLDGPKVSLPRSAPGGRDEP